MHSAGLVVHLHKKYWPKNEKNTTTVKQSHAMNLYDMQSIMYGLGILLATATFILIIEIAHHQIGAFNLNSNGQAANQFQYTDPTIHLSEDKV